MSEGNALREHVGDKTWKHLLWLAIEVIFSAGPVVVVAYLFKAFGSSCVLLQSVYSSLYKQEAN